MPHIVSLASQIIIYVQDLECDLITFMSNWLSTQKFNRNLFITFQVVLLTCKWLLPGLRYGLWSASVYDLYPYVKNFIHAQYGWNRFSNIVIS